MKSVLISAVIIVGMVAFTFITELGNYAEDINPYNQEDFERVDDERKNV